MIMFVCRIVSDSQWERLVARMGLRSLCIISIGCRYSNPLAASASFRAFQELRIVENKTKAVDFGAF